MKLSLRLLYYLIGFSIGLILLFFFLGEKKTSFDYSPNARVLKNIRLKKRQFSEQAQRMMEIYKIDTAHISNILKKGDVNFSKSNTKLDSCKIYYIEGTPNKQPIALHIENCNLMAKINIIEVID